VRPLLVFTFVLLLAAGPAASRITSFDFAHEAGEPHRAALDAAGQMNCVREAIDRAATERCALEATGADFNEGVVEGFRLLEAWHTTFVGLYQDGTTGHASVGLGGYGSNTERNFGLPDLIPPGASRFFAWSGFWNDLNGNRVLDLEETANPQQPSNPTRGPNHEWARSPEPVVAYLEPGSHPGFMSASAAAEGTPDIRFVDRVFSYPHHEQEPAPGPVLFLEGSLLSPVTMTTVSAAILAPDGATPYTLRTNSRVDVDRYVAVAPGPVASLYAATLGPIVTPNQSPTLGAYRVELPPLGGTGLESTAGPAYAALYASYPVEHAPDSMSTAAGRHADFVSNYAGWIDLLPRSGYAEGSSVFQATAYTLRVGGTGSSLGRGVDGGQAVLPGALLHFELRLGLWKDIDGDGFVGTARAGDAYESGTRPSPDDYHNARGEFFGTVARYPSLSSKEKLFATLVPDESWGPGGVRFVGRGEGESQQAPNGGTTPVKVALGFDPRSPGLYTSHTMFFPAGTLEGGFTVCIEPVLIHYVDAAGVEVRETLKDCDRFERLA